MISLWNKVVSSWRSKWYITLELSQTRGPKGHISCTRVHNVQPLSKVHMGGRSTSFFHRQGKHKFCRGSWDLTSGQVSLNSVKRFQRTRRKCLSRTEARATILSFLIDPKKKSYRTLRYYFLSSLVEFRSAVSEEKSKMSQPIRGRVGYLVFWGRPEQHKLGRGC